MNKLVKRNILGIGITDESLEEVLKYIFISLEKKGDSYYIVTPNPEMIVRSRKDDEFKETLNRARLAVCDGVGLLWASRLLGKPLKQRITGVDLLESLCKESVRNGVNIGFLGGRDSVAERTAECLMEKYPGLQVSFVGEEWNDAEFELAAKRKTKQNFTRNQAEIPLSLRPLPKGEGRGEGYPHLDIDILFVAFGAPKQEQWMAENQETGKYRVALGVGGAFDYLSGNVARAPRLLQAMGLEWLYRLIRQPWRWKRQLALVEFMGLVLKERFKVQKVE